MTRIIVPLAIVLLLAACPTDCQHKSLTGATDVGPVRTFTEEIPMTSPTARPWRTTVPNWQPWLGIHGFAWHQNLQQPYLDLMCQTGAIQGIRIDVMDNAPEISAWARSCGAEVLGIFGNEHLRSANVVQNFCNAANANPGIIHWEIGNEVKNFIQMDAESYMPIFLDVFRHAADHHPGLELIAAAPIGAVGGLVHTRKMIELGLYDLAEHGYRTQDGSVKQLNVLAFHYYGNRGTFSHGISEMIQGMPPHVRIWVTETGTEKESHVDWVRNEVPRLLRMTRVDRVYWYIATGCDPFALVRNPNKWCDEGPAGLSPLYRLLAEVE